MEDVSHWRRDSWALLCWSRLTSVRLLIQLPCGRWLAAGCLCMGSRIGGEPPLLSRQRGGENKCIPLLSGICSNIDAVTLFLCAIFLLCKSLYIKHLSNKLWIVLVCVFLSYVWSLTSPLPLAALQCVNDVKPCVNNATCVTFSNGTGYCR